MTQLLLLVTGFVAAYIVALRVRTALALRQYEDQIPQWVNQGNRAVIGTYDEVLQAIHECVHIELWEQELEAER